MLVGGWVKFSNLDVRKPILSGNHGICSAQEYASFIVLGGQQCGANFVASHTQNPVGRYFLDPLEGPRIRPVLPFPKSRKVRENPVCSFLLNQENAWVESGPFVLGCVFFYTGYPCRVSSQIQYRISCGSATQNSFIARCVEGARAVQEMGKGGVKNVKSRFTTWCFRSCRFFELPT